MAITDSHPRIKIEIISNGAPLREYVDQEEEDAPNAVTKYIEAVSSAEFQIGCTLTTPFPETAILYQIYLDGKFTRGFFSMLDDYKPPLAHFKVSGLCHSDGQDWFQSNFCFSSLTIDDSDLATAGDDLHQSLKEMGEISIKAFGVKNLRESTSDFPRRELSSVGTIPEKALKGRALTHSADLRPPRATGKTTIWNYDHADPMKQPLMTFKFRYRSRQALKALLIIPRSPSPVPLAERDVDNLTPDEMRELLKRQRERLEREEVARNVKTEGIKRERSGNDSPTRQGDDDDVSFLFEKRRRLNVTVDEAGVETIDLT